MRTNEEIKSLKERLRLTKESLNLIQRDLSKKERQTNKVVRASIIEVFRNLFDLSDDVNIEMYSSHFEFLKLTDINTTLELNFSSPYELSVLEDVEISASSINSSLGEEVNKQKLALISHLFNRYAEIEFIKLFNNNPLIIEMKERIERENKEFEEIRPTIEELINTIKLTNDALKEHYQTVFYNIVSEEGYTFKDTFHLEINAKTEWRCVKTLRINKVSPKTSRVTATQKFSNRLSNEYLRAKCRHEKVFEQAFERYYKEVKSKW